MVLVLSDNRNFSVFFFGPLLNAKGPTKDNPAVAVAVLSTLRRFISMKLCGKNF